MGGSISGDLNIHFSSGTTVATVMNMITITIYIPFVCAFYNS